MLKPHCNQNADQLPQNGCIKSDNELTKPQHFLPHKYILKRDKQSIRVVYDASARTKANFTLNDCLYSGPSLVSELIKILMRFRFYKTGFICDIVTAFLNIEIATKHRPVMSFLWRRNGDLNQPLEIYRCNRAAFGMRSSPFLLQSILIHHFEKFKEYFPVASNLGESIYIDDIVSGSNDDNDVPILITQIINLLKLASMSVHKINSNSHFVRDFLRQEDIQSNFPDITKVLGLIWDLSYDTLSVDLSSFIDTPILPTYTKAEILSIVAGLFDPLGICSAYLVRAKLIFQQLCVLKIKWDENVPPEIYEEFTEWLSGFPILAKSGLFNTARFIFNPAPATVPKVDSNTSNVGGLGARSSEGIYCNSPPPTLNSDTHSIFTKYTPMILRVFTDASLQSHCVVIYAEVTLNGKTYLRQVISKVRVASLNKKLTIPRAELMSALLGARLANTTKQYLSDFNITDIQYYTDSCNVIYWIKGMCKNWVPFVQHRLLEIHSLTSPHAWNFISTKYNIADVGTRPITAEKFIQIEGWFGNLNLPTDLANPNLTFDSIPDDLRSEVRKKIVTLHTESEPEPCVSNLINVNNFSTLNQLIRVTSAVLKAVNLFKRDRLFLMIDLDNQSLKMWILATQAVYFPDEIKGSKPGPLTTLAGEKQSTPLIKQLQLFTKDGVLRCTTRYLESPHLGFDQKYPILLPSKASLTRLIILDTHEYAFHSGISHTLATLRQKYWVINGRSNVRSVINACLMCRRLKLNPYIPPVAPKLPQFRLEESTPFTFTAVDFAGPLYVKGLKKDKLGKDVVSKCYIAVFTCLVFRAVSLELVCDLTAGTFVNALIRFFNQWGACKIMLSDNFKFYEKTAADLADLLDSPQVKKLARLVKVKWIFSTELAPWTNGAAEATVKIVKGALRRTFGRAMLTYDEMSTALSSVQHICNKRPLLLQGDSSIDQYPLTPNDLILGYRTKDLPTDHIKPAELKTSSVFGRKRFKYLQSLKDIFWKRFHKEYLNELTTYHFRTRGRTGGGDREPKVGDICLLKNEKVPRNTWKTARVISVVRASDGLIRKVEVKPASHLINDGRVSNTFRHPSMLIPLDLDDSPSSVNPNQGTARVKLPARVLTCPNSVLCALVNCLN